MTDETSPRSGAAVTEPPPSPYDAADTVWTPTEPSAAARPADAPARSSLRERVVELWLALAVGAACLVVGLGLGAVIGHATAGSGSDGFPQPPGVGSGPDGQGFGDQGRDGQGSGGPGFGGPGSGEPAPGSQSGSQSGTGTTS